ncbi:MAG TPA: tetratricopeptide repeat protein, partial [Herpetosiphonaceae bacterium]
LARQSLLRHADGLAAAEPRFMMLETIREFAVEQLEQRGDAARIRRRHAEYAMRLAADASASWGTPQRPEWAARIDQEQENMRAALAWLLDTGAAEQALRLALLLEPFWAMRANFSEGRRWIERALAPETRPALPPELEAQAYAALSGNCFATADLAAGVPYMERNLELQRALGDPGQISKALVLFGMAMRNLGDFPRATALLEESLAVSRASGDRHGEAQALNDLGLLVFFQDDLDQAIAYSEASLALFRALGAGGGIAIALNDLGEMVRFGGDYARAAALYDESLALARQQGNQRQVMFGLGNLASALLMLGDDGRAGPLFAESLALLREAEMIHLTGFCLDGLGGVAARRGAPARAARLLAASSAMAVRSEQIRSPADEQLYQTHLELARAQLAPAAWEAAWAEGSALGVEAAIALALEPLDADTA